MTTAGLASLLPIPVAAPLAAAALCPITGRWSRRLPLAIALAALSTSAVVLLLMSPDVYRGRALATFFGHWGPISGSGSVPGVLGDAFAADGWGLNFALICAVVGALIALFALSSLADLGKRELGQFAALFLLLDAALIGSALTADVINLFVWFEVAALASYALTGFFLERPISLEAAFKVLVLTNVASFVVFLGSAFIYERTGAVNFGQVFHSIASHRQFAEAVALGLLLAGFATKAGLVPFHAWLPDAHTAAPGPISALFSGLMVNLGIVAIARIVFQLYTPARSGPALGLLMVLGLVSALGGAFFALLQDDLKRLLAYDTISQMGVLAVGLAAGHADGVAGAAYHLINHALFKSLLFLCAGAIVHMTGEDKLSQMGGLFRRMPAIAVAFTVGAVAIAGIPPLNGYAGVGLIHEDLLDHHQYFPLAVMLLAQVVTVAALGKATWQAFYRRPQKESFSRQERLHPGMVGALATLCGACLAFGVLAGILLPDMAGPAAATLLHPSAYASAILGSGGPIPKVHLSFDYFDPTELLLLAATLAVALPTGRLLLSARARPAVERVRSVMSGSVNDYAAYLTLGIIGSLGAVMVR